MFCSQCGEKVLDNSKFCGVCGNRLQIDDNTFLPELELNDEQLLKTYVGEVKKSYYFKKWEGNKKQSWNWSAFFANFFWLGYRKMYKMILLFLGLLILVDIFIVLMEWTDEPVANIIGFSIAYSIGISGNYIYKQHAEKEIRKLKTEYSGSKLLDQVHQRGGVSWNGVFLSIGLVICYVILSVFTESVMLSTMDKEKIPASSEANRLMDTEEQQTVEEIEESITGLLNQNYKAMRDKDIKTYMSTIYKGRGSNDIYDETAETIGNLFKEYDLEYGMHDIEFISVNEKEVQVRLRQITKRISGGAFRDNESIIIHTFKHEKGQWKILNSELESVQYLNVADNSSNEDDFYIVLEAPELFDFFVQEDIDINNDGVLETVTLVGGIEGTSSYVNENVGIIVEFADATTTLSLGADGAPLLYLFDIDQDGWMELLYETGYRISTVEVYHFGEDGLELQTTLLGSLLDIEPFKVTTNEDVYHFDNEIASSNDFYEEAEFISNRSCIACHGENLEGASGPALNTIGSYLSQDEIEDVILNGMGGMPGGLVSQKDAELLARWLETLK